MKNLVYFLFCTTLISCNTKRINTLNIKHIVPNSIESKLTKTEANIINDFIDVELKNDRYKNYKDSEIVVIEEALKKMKPISDYEFNLKYKESWGKFIHNWILDSLQVIKIKLELEKEEIYHWKISDFKNIKVKLIKYEELRTIINTSAYANFSSQIIIYLSSPLIIDDNNAFLSFEIGNGQLGFQSINHFTVLMTKVNSKWIEKEYYYDNVFH